MNPSKLNNHAVAEIGANDFDKAISTLTKALKRIQLVIMSGDVMITDTADTADAAMAMSTDGEDMDGRYNSSRALCFEFLTCGSSSFLTSVENGRISPRSMFRDPIHLSSTVFDCEIEQCEKLSCVIIYNLALAHHLRAMEEQNETSRQSHLHKALTLYEHAHQILVSEDEIHVSLLHSMAIACNLGHVHHMTGNEPASQVYFQHLLSAILYVVDCGEGGKLKLLDGFFCNVMSLIASVSSAPAA
jgi:hypothetical protein